MDRSGAHPSPTKVTQLPPTKSVAKPTRGHGWSGKKKRDGRPPVDGRRPVGRPRHLEVVCEEPLNEHLPRSRIALALWSKEYGSALARELLVYADNGILAAAEIMLDVAPASTYVAQLRGERNPTALMKRVLKCANATFRWCSEATHLKNQKVLPFQMAARSIAMVAHKHPYTVWRDDHSVTSKHTANELVHEMTACRPAPEYTMTLRARLNFYDQVPTLTLVVVVAAAAVVVVVVVIVVVVAVVVVVVAVAVVAVAVYAHGMAHICAHESRH
jgi:hypothetical protein